MERTEAYRVINTINNLLDYKNRLEQEDNTKQKNSNVNRVPAGEDDFF